MSDVHPSPSATDAVSKGVVDGDRQRRMRDTGRLVWRIAPAVAAVALMAAVGRRWLGWPAAIPWFILAAGAVGLAFVEYLGRRARPINDEVANRLDADAGLGGELRSAAWFSVREGRDAWADLHLARAARRVRDIEWTDLYPRARAVRARAATTVMMVAAIGLTITLPVRSARFGAPGSGSGVPATPDDAMKMLELSPELQKKLDELLSSIERDKLSPAEAAAKAGELKDLLAELSKLDPEALKKLEAAGANTGDPSAKMDAKTLADRAKRDANAPSLPADLKKALQEIANQLDKTKKSENAAAEQQSGPPGAASPDTPQQGKSDQAAKGDAQQSSSIQMSREASAAAGAPQMMMTGSGAASNDPNPGQGAKNGGGKFTAIEQALKRELIEAASDQLGDNVTTEIHKKTEQGRATASFTHAGAATFDRGHASAPPPVPDARRAQVQNYFIRKQ